MFHRCFICPFMGNKTNVMSIAIGSFVANYSRIKVTTYALIQIKNAN